MSILHLGQTVREYLRIEEAHKLRDKVGSMITTSERASYLWQRTRLYNGKCTMSTLTNIKEGLTQMVEKEGREKGT